MHTQTQMVIDMPMPSLVVAPEPGQTQPSKSFYEFFAGAGMARAGLGSLWTCLFANDFDPKKARVYHENWGHGCLKTADVASLVVQDLPGTPDLIWGSFPCQDLSLAGAGAGLRGERSGTFWPFWKLIRNLIDDGRAPQMIALENVCGALSSHGGSDFTAICEAFAHAGYRVGAIVIDAARFVPQSRPRLFIVGVRSDTKVPRQIVRNSPHGVYHPAAIDRAFSILPSDVQTQWIWWSLPTPLGRTQSLQDIIEAQPTSVNWHTPEQTQQVLAMMSDINRAKVVQAQRSGHPTVGCIYKRTRKDESGRKVQRAEVRFDDLAGCLRTPAGGSSRQIVLVVNGEHIRSRLLSTRETARLMGLPDSYSLPDNYNEAYHLTGDGVAVPVVRFLSENLFEPILNESRRSGVL
jgi:DNA (cytosine-5)-methyltransferase 1